MELIVPQICHQSFEDTDTRHDRTTRRQGRPVPGKILKAWQRVCKSQASCHSSLFAQRCEGESGTRTGGRWRTCQKLHFVAVALSISVPRSATSAHTAFVYAQRNSLNGPLVDEEGFLDGILRDGRSMHSISSPYDPDPWPASQFATRGFLPYPVCDCPQTMFHVKDGLPPVHVMDGDDTVFQDNIQEGASEHFWPTLSTPTRQ